MSNSLMNKNTWSGTTEAYVALFDPNTNAPIGEMLKYDARNFGGGSTGSTSSVERIIHSKLMVIKENETDYNNMLFLPINAMVGNPYISDNGAFNQGDISENYANSQWEFTLEDGTIIGDAQSFATLSDMYSYLQTIAPNDGLRYTQTVFATVFDVIDNSIEPIEKIYGVNTFTHVLNGGSKGSHIYVNSNGDTNWDYLSKWIEELYDITGIDTGHVYANDDERIVKIPNNYKKSFGHYNSEVANNFRIENSKFVYNMSDGTISHNHQGDYYMDYNMSKYSARNISNDSDYYWIDFNSIGELNNTLLNSDYSVVAVYIFRSKSDSNLVTVYVKPLNIDTIYLDYFDKAKYDLYKIEDGIDSYHKYTKINLSGVEQSQDVNITRLLPFNYYDNNLSVKKYSKFSIITDFHYRFILKDKLTNQFSPISKMKVDWYSGGHKRNNMIFCRVRK